MKSLRSEGADFVCGRMVGVQAYRLAEHGFTDEHTRKKP